MSLEKNADMYSLNVDKVGTYDFDVLIKTPISNYQTLKATFRQSGTVGTLEIFRNAKRISKLVVDAEVKGRFWENSMSGKLKVIYFCVLFSFFYVKLIFDGWKNNGAKSIIFWKKIFSFYSEIFFLKSWLTNLKKDYKSLFHHFSVGEKK